MSEPVPQRIGDAERDRAAGYLQEHLAQGRLSQEEFDDRIETALSARTAADLTPLFTDLPAPRPDATEITPVTPGWPTYAPPSGVEPANTSAVSKPATPSPPANAPSPAGEGPPKALLIATSIVWPAWLLVMFATSWHFWWLVFVPVMVSAVVGRVYGDQGRNRFSGRDRERYRRRRLEE